MTSPEQTTTSRVLLYDEEGRVVLFKRPITSNTRGGDLDMTGGKIDEDISPDATLEEILLIVGRAGARETREESSLDLNTDDLEMVYAESYYDDGRAYTHYFLKYTGLVTAEMALILTEHDATARLRPETARRLIESIPHQRAVEAAMHA